MKARNLTIGYTFIKEKEIPTIRLSGNWLADYGFQIGRKVTVAETAGEIHIRLTLDDENAKI